MIGSIIVATFQFCFMALAVDVIDRHGRNALPVTAKEERYISLLYSSKRRFSHPSLLTTQSASSGCVVQVENGEIRRRQLYPKKTEVRL